MKAHKTKTLLAAGISAVVVLAAGNDAQALDPHGPPNYVAHHYNPRYRAARRQPAWDHTGDAWHNGAGFAIGHDSNHTDIVLSHDYGRRAVIRQTNAGERTHITEASGLKRHRRISQRQ